MAPRGGAATSVTLALIDSRNHRPPAASSSTVTRRPNGRTVNVAAGHLDKHRVPPVSGGPALVASRSRPVARGSL